VFDSLVHHKSGFVRKSVTTALRVVRHWQRWHARPEDYARRPPVFANSFPKSGTHLLDQLVGALPDVVNYGAIWGTMTSSFQFRERTPANVAALLASFAPGELVRGHLHCDDAAIAGLAAKNVVNYFIYRDPRAVVLSEAHYLRDMNRFHRLHSYFKRTSSMTEAIALSIRGLGDEAPGIVYPNIAERFARFAGWLRDPNCFCVKFEELVGAEQPAVVRRMAEFYARHRAEPIDVETVAARMIASVAPEKSHTFRTGKKSGWRSEFTPQLRRLFADTAGDLLVELRYETDNSWADI
jgi:sulfotransferase 6B1